MKEKTAVKAKKKHIVLKVFAAIMAILVINSCLNRFCWRSFGFLYCDYIGTMPDRASQVYDESKGMYCTRVLVSYGHGGLLLAKFDGFVYKIEGSTLKVGVNRQFRPFLTTSSYSAGLEFYTDAEITEVYLCDAFHERPIEMVEYYDEFFPYYTNIVKETCLYSAVGYYLTALLFAFYGLQNRFLSFNRRLGQLSGYNARKRNL